MKKRGENLLSSSKKSKLILNNSRGQVWIETAMYLLVALVMIGLVIAFVGPKITEMQDKALLQQSATMLKDINNLIFSIAQGGSGNVREAQLVIKKGTLTIDSQNDTIFFEMESSYAYSEIGKKIDIGGINVSTRKVGRLNIVNMTAVYSNYDITFGNEDKEKIISMGATPYKLFISNQGGTKTKINFEIN
ncbi:MAG TPA: hypothetical protein PLK34_03005 [Candidatus Pacearchaeota archaeon]|nr:hypothetical protein [Candidatus Pacearchaeota archaeon]